MPVRADTVAPVPAPCWVEEATNASSLSAFSSPASRTSPFRLTAAEEDPCQRGAWRGWTVLTDPRAFGERPWVQWDNRVNERENQLVPHWMQFYVACPRERLAFKRLAWSAAIICERQMPDSYRRGATGLFLSHRALQKVSSTARACNLLLWSAVGGEPRQCDNRMIFFLCFFTILYIQQFRISIFSGRGCESLWPLIPRLFSFICLAICIFCPTKICLQLDISKNKDTYDLDKITLFAEPSN